jgi:hypothetical protein
MQQHSFFFFSFLVSKISRPKTVDRRLCSNFMAKNNAKMSSQPNPEGGRENGNGKKKDALNAMKTTGEYHHFIPRFILKKFAQPCE